MRKLFLLFFAASLFIGCGGKEDKSKDKDDDKTEEKKKGDDDEVKKKSDDETSESTKGAWSDEDKDMYKADYAKTFKTMKQNLQNDGDFDEADFDKESKKVTSCTLRILENKYESYADYKKASKKESFQQNRDLMNEIADCQQEFMDKYNRN